MTHERVLAALAEPTRRALFEHLSRRPASVGELTEAVSISQPAVSQHLRVLREARLVTVERVAQRRIYHVRREGLADLRRYLDGFWSSVLDAFAEGHEGVPEEKGEQP